MRMRNLVVSLVLLPALASAQTPTATRGVVPTPPPPPVREIVVPKGAVTSLTLKLRFTTMVVLPEGDDVVDVICGDDSVVTITPLNNIVHLKPSKEGLSTNMNLVTASGTIYSFILAEGSKADTLVLYVNRNQHDTSTGKIGTPKYYPAAALADLQAELKAAREERALIEKDAALRLAAAVQEAPTKLRFAYQRLPNEKPFFIQSIYHDGAMTYVKHSSRELPVIYEILDKKPSFLNYEVPRPDTYVIKKVVSEGYFQLGKKKLTFKSVE